jgi:hypothetical protein
MRVGNLRNRMKKAKISLCVLLALGFLTGTYLIGYRIGQRDDDRTHLHLSIAKDVYLYHQAESGDLTTVQSTLGFFTLGDYNFYETHYRGENWSTAKLEAARRIAALAATNGSVVLITN